ncbi:hypothetical protein HOLleu_10820 [Holothuria leucospilota]|uniref:Uncharacterized protein n=1 Tax=Holothuria leucospilota TaxID=206669 RepID=A0A9Q1HER7_HOLLE|nr:hypothetical protein HOLleu_10820 [Holothuria leucospilota]
MHVQCELVPLPPLELKPKPASTLDVTEGQVEKTPELAAILPQPSSETSPTKYFPEGSFSEDSSGPSGPKQPSSPIYEPSSHSSDVHSDDPHASTSKPTHPVNQDRFFLVMESCLLLLFKLCDLCMGPVEAVVWKTVGTFIRIKKQCRHCGSITFWDSQEFVSSTPEGNLKLSAGILFLGSKP